MSQLGPKRSQLVPKMSALQLLSRLLGHFRCPIGP